MPAQPPHGLGPMRGLLTLTLILTLTTDPYHCPSPPRIQQDPATSSPAKVGLVCRECCASDGNSSVCVEPEPNSPGAPPHPHTPSTKPRLSSAPVRPSPLMRALLPSNVLAPATRVYRRGRGRRRAQRRVRRGHAGRVLLQGARAGERSMRCAQEVHAAADPMRRQSRDGQPGARVACPHIPQLGCQGEWTPLAPGCDSIASRCPWATTSTATTRWLWT